MTERSHLSIGEVLNLLQDEFPDITISKIRFLESQGLLDPERTPSGYRKFYEEDIERLRWILRQQKENFLPLKVIKDRLASGQLDEPASAPDAAVAGGRAGGLPIDDVTEPTSAAEPARAAQPARAGRARPAGGGRAGRRAGGSSGTHLGPGRRAPAVGRPTPLATPGQPARSRAGSHRRAPRDRSRPA